MQLNDFAIVLFCVLRHRSPGEPDTPQSADYTEAGVHLPFNTAGRGSGRHLQHEQQGSRVP